MKNQRILSGIQPSGNLHIGNYLGAIKQFVELQNEYEAFYCIVDEHAITVPQDPKELHKNTLDLAMIYLAAGIDPKKSVIFVQSHVPAHTELGWILNTMTPLGELERMTQFKDKSERHAREGVYAGLFNYPTLMAADILLYHAQKVPVGEDQLQHIELTRSLAERFNNRFGNTFTIPEPLIREYSGRIMGLDDPSKKMSKSAGNSANYIALLDSPDEIRRKIKIAVTDSGKEVTFDEQEKPAVSNLMRIMSAFRDCAPKEVEMRYEGKGYAEFKDDLAELLVEKLTPLQEKYRILSENQDEVLLILAKGAMHARAVADKTLAKAKEKIGLVPINAIT